MDDQTATEQKPNNPFNWKDLLSAILQLAAFVGTLHLLHTYIFDHQETCYSSVFAYTALHFGTLSLSFSAWFLVLAMLPPRQPHASELLYFDADSPWGSQRYRALIAVSNIGYALVMFASGWMFTGSYEGVWPYFIPMFCLGMTIMAACSAFLRWKFVRLRSTTARVNAVKLGLFVIGFSAFLVLWARAPVYFDPVGVIVIYALASATAGICVGIADIVKWQRDSAVGS